MTREVVLVGDDKKRRRQWAEVPRTVHGDAPGWTPDLIDDAVAAQDPRKNPLHRYADIAHFLLLEDGRPVGRVAATWHHTYVEKFRPLGFFGFLDCIPDEGAVTALLDAAQRWLAERGATAVGGPYNYWSGQDMGLLLDRFDERVSAFQTWNPAALPPILERIGFRPSTKLSTFRFASEDMDAGKRRLEPMAARVRASLDLHVRPAHKRTFTADMESVRALFNASFASSPEVIPYEHDVFWSMVKPIKALLDLELIRLVEKDGEVIGFALAIPDLGDILVELNGKLRLRDLPRIPLMKRRIRSAVVLLVGVRPGAPMGIGHVIAVDLAEALQRRGYHEVTSTWVHDENATMRAILEGALGGRPDRHYALVERRVGP